MPLGSARSASQQGCSGSPSLQEEVSAVVKAAAHESEAVPFVVVEGGGEGGALSTVMLQVPSKRMLQAQRGQAGGIGLEEAGRCG